MFLLLRSYDGPLKYLNKLLFVSDLSTIKSVKYFMSVWTCYKSVMVQTVELIISYFADLIFHYETRFLNFKMSFGKSLGLVQISGHLSKHIYIYTHTVQATELFFVLTSSFAVFTFCIKPDFFI